MIYLVDWKEIVGDFMETFLAIAGRKGNSYSGFSREDASKYSMKLSMMSRCGYATWTSGKIEKRPRGWNPEPYFVNGEIRYKYDDRGHEEVTIIPLSRFLDIKRSLEQDDVEESYYNTAGLIHKTMRDISKPKARKDIDDTFVRED